jgi:tetratricopeptide (TPR) repeat protein
MGFWSTLFGGGRSPEEKAARAQDKAHKRAARDAEAAAQRARHNLALFDRALGNDPENASLGARRKAAIALVVGGKLPMAREAWLAISRDYPSELAMALEQVGVCYHLEKDYAAALTNYEAAIRVGADPGQLADNIAEARKGLAGVG